MSLLLSTAFALFAGLMMTRAFKRLRLSFPDVTAYLIAGVCVGPYGLGALGVPSLGFASMEELTQVNILCRIALGFIAFDIGNEFRLAQLRQMGKAATVIGIFQAVAASLATGGALVTLSFAVGRNILPLPAAIVLGAIASATAPAATLMVVRQFKAKGPVTSLLLPIVALDDAVGLVIFAVAMGMAQAMSGGTLNAVSVLAYPMLEIAGSLLLGVVMGGLLSWLEKMFFSNTNRLAMTIAFVLMTIALSARLNLSALLVCMMLGTTFCNLSEYSADIMRRSEQWSAPLYAVFFVLSGAELELGVFRYPVVVLIGVVYVIARCLGKYFGASWSSELSGCGPVVKKYLGITLFPQAGVALGMAIGARALGAETGGLISNIVLFSVFVYELAGPMLTKMALTKAGEIAPAASQEAYRARFEKR
ncbi:MAG: cation:proton antiporter [Synergistaceae bacterium]|nr:cation:proton antiporter [Synergistaceae bacterium]